jgi:hypothetical protein
MQVMGAADVYLLNGPHGWELAGIDTGVCSGGRRIVSMRRACPASDRIVDWTQLQTYAWLTSSTRPWGPRSSSQRRPPEAAGSSGVSGRPTAMTAVDGNFRTRFQFQPGAG